MDQTVSNASGRSLLTDQIIASDLLIYAKTSINTYASAIAVSSTPTVRSMLKKQLDQAISFQEQVNAYITERGWFNAYDISQQLETDVEQAQNALKMLT